MKIFALNEPLNAQVKNIAADKSISHRSAIFSLLSDKKSVIKNYLMAEDTINTLKIVENLGAKVEIDGLNVQITPPEKIKEPSSILECGNSGTAMRIFMGLLASSDGFFVLNGDIYLNERPMRRVGDPLAKVGAKFDGRDNGDKAPLCIRGKKLEYFEYESKIASAQVKTAMILSALKSNGCKFIEPELSRDHSERILIGMGADIKRDGLVLDVSPIKKPLNPLEIFVPNDPSSAFYFAVAACIMPGSKVVLKNILLNKTRVQAYKVLQKMGANIKFELSSSLYEDIGDITVEYAPLHGVEVSQNISWLIDEAPALAVAFANASGESVLRNAKELRVKECDRIAVTVKGLQTCGIEANELEDGFIIKGGVAKPAIIDSFGDHRIAMSFAILGLKCGMIIEADECIATSFPNFKEILASLGVSIEN
ncbi:3-phosphoshikimate 1-carboxyvinyltransferase [Campylobacter geochelonis]|uniref:3-phosphoshikimate 1-carboxyvinyltransferase n=1 Tax=Campylobacter geochelonis TaxID=1780362 RepID=A0A128EEI6_9BACT|nr:3-phosphoshikimate 1-carboxyvinyltransferase [Campylobacter geochelonis]QKF70914.1 3-phosphoshikimate 1-carboxyvinyltransferase [Campylobacter geochelonis]CZE46951.1 3-phosphoshikimate 1-carboxyvinyltransferase [Campylobacter geochelonis]CZE51239.1 3-phosphoshikimate 1-carboxyvinyltransferase [Campylobacter geochelonis]